MFWYLWQHFLVYNLSGDTLFYDLDREELQYMPGDKRSMFLGVEYLGVLGVFVVPGVAELRVPGKVAL